jgi:hypothetical protein
MRLRLQRIFGSLRECPDVAYFVEKVGFLPGGGLNVWVEMVRI